MVLLNLVFYIYTFFVTDGAFIRCYYNSIDNYTVTLLSEPLAILNSTCYDSNRPTVIYTFGYNAKTNGPVTTVVINSYIENGKVNFLLLDWEEEAKSGILGVAAGYVATGVPGAMKIGAQLGEAIVKMANMGLDLKKLHLIAHSLGAHLMGYAGKEVIKHDRIVGRITGLDPSGPLYSTVISIKGLEKGCATLVDVVHTDPGSYGITDSVGDIDIWANCEMALQPGCPPRNGELLSQNDRCSHDRSAIYYSESINSPEAFPAIKALSCQYWKSGGGKDNETVYIGENIDNAARGNFYLKTASSSPYGLGTAGTKP